MKKLVLFIAAFVVIGLANVNAQGVVPAAKTTQTTSTQNRTTTHITNAGTPDRRFKENKAGAIPATPVKVRADGQPDMRYKQNKETTALKSAATKKTVHVTRATSSSKGQ